MAIGRDGTLASVFDRELVREVLVDRGNQLWAYADKPRAWDAWDIDDGYELANQELGQLEEIRIVETGPLRAAARVARRWRDSRIAQTYRLLAGSRRLDIVTEIDWHERQVLLRALFPVAVRAPHATYETMYGALTRPTHANTSWERARFELSAHRFVDLSEPGYGVALLNDGKYGHSARGNTLGLSLLRSPVYPDRTPTRVPTASPTPSSPTRVTGRQPGLSTRRWRSTARCAWPWRGRRAGSCRSSSGWSRPAASRCGWAA